MKADFLVDIGNVLLSFDFGKFLAAGFGDPERLEVARGLLEAGHIPFESGRLEVPEFISGFREKAGYTQTDEEFSEAWNCIFTVNEPMHRVMNDLAAAGHRLILFSNTNPLHAPSFLKKYRVFENFEGHHFSHQVGAVKPEDAFYQAAVDRWDLVPERTFYIDDLAVNIEKGREFGFECHQYDVGRHEAFLKWLEANVEY